MSEDTRDWHQLLKRLDGIVAIQTRIAIAEESIAISLKQIAVNTAPSPYAVRFQMILVQKENTDMQKGKIVRLISKAAKAGDSAPTQLSDSAPQAIAVFGIDAAGAYGAQLAPGASIEMSAGTGASGTPGTFVQDQTPGTFNFTDPNGVARTSVPSLASGVFTPSATPDVNDPFAISYQITGGSGDSGSAQFVTAVGVEVSEVIGLPTANPQLKK